MKPILLSLFALSLGALPGQTLPVDCKKSPMFIFNDLQHVSRLHNLTIDSAAGIALLEPLPLAAGSSINGIGFRQQDKMVYGCQGDRLVRIDGTGAAEMLTTMSFGAVAGDVTPDGRYLVLATFTGLLFIDLESGSFEEKTVEYAFSGGQQTLITTDIAFNPVSGILYGFDANERKLAVIDPVTGKVTSSQFPVTDISTGLAALFFDSYGNLWGCGTYFDEKYLYRISTFSGEILAKIPVVFESSGRLDGCSCPGAFNFQKTAFPDRISHCGGLDYIFTISNRTGQTQQGIQLEDRMPDGVSIEQIVRNPFGGQVLNGPGTDHLLLDNLTVPVGVDSVIVRVRVDHLPSGIYKNQAVLKNVRIQSTQPENLLSDDPRTHFLLDSTAFHVEDLFATLHPETLHICPGDVLQADATLLGAIEYDWDTGEQTPAIEIKAGGIYTVEIRTGCETAADTFYVEDAALRVDLGEDVRIEIGDTLRIVPEISGPAQYLHVEWTVDGPGDPGCLGCLEKSVSPFERTVYVLQLYNEYGCTATDELDVQVERHIFVPNIFSPDGDGANDVFYIQSANDLQIAVWKIFDRWGDLVFERRNIRTNDTSEGWSPGAGDRKVPPGAYAWMAEIAYPDGKKAQLRGDVTVYY